MKVYTFGDQSKPVMMLFPGTCCYWKNNFGHVIEGVKEYFYVTIVSYSGFDETEHSTFISELDETKKIEQYIQEYFNGHIFAVYGCSLGGSFVSLLLSRENIHIDHAIIGSSDMDQTSKLLAKLQTALVISIIYPLITGKGSRLAKKFISKRMNTQDENANYRKKFMELMGIGSGIDFFFISKVTYIQKWVNKSKYLIQQFMYSIQKRWVKSIENVMKNISNNLISLNLI